MPTVNYFNFYVKDETDWNLPVIAGSKALLKANLEKTDNFTIVFKPANALPK